MNPELARSLQKPAAPPAPAPAGAMGRILRWIVFLGILAAGAYFVWPHRETIKDAVTKYFSSPAAANGRAGRTAGPAPVVASRVGRGDIRIYLSAQGTVTPFKTVTLRTRVDGQIISIAFKEGQLVHENDPLLEIDPRQFQVQLEQARGQLDKDNASLKNALIDLQRYQMAFKNGGAVSDQQVATQQALVDQEQGTVVSDQSQIDAAQLELVYCHITSPITGRIGLRLVDLGNIVHAADAGGLAVITQLQPIAVIFNLPEDDLGQVVGTPGGGDQLPVDVYDRDDQQVLASGVVEAVDNQVDPTSGTFKVKARFENKDNILFPNEFVNAHLLASTLKNTTIAPTAAVQHGPDGSTFVYLVGDDQTVHIHNVTEGQAEGDIESITGLNVGDMVVTDGTDKLQDSSKVTVTLADIHGQPSTRPTTRASTRPGGRRGGNRSATRRSE